MSVIRKKTIAVKVGDITIGGDNSVVVQSMTNTDTADIKSTVTQVAALAQAGSELVRLTVNTAEAAAAVAPIREQLDRMNIDVPLIGDFHFNGHKLLAAYPGCAESLAKYRINPGNVGKGSRRDSHFESFIEIACNYNKPVRIGVNWGSLDQSLVVRLMDENARSTQPEDTAIITRKALIVSALESAEQAKKIGLRDDQIVLSCKMSGVQDLISVYRDLASRTDHALHLGLTEAGMGIKGIVSSSAALSVLLQEGIGDTIRVSLTPEPGQPRTDEVRVSQQILQSLGMRSFAPEVIACPGCGRTTSTYFQELAQQITNYINDQMPTWKVQFPGVENMQVAVMGCVVNGPGESKHANIGISLPGSNERPVAPVYVDGEKTVTLKGENIAGEFQNLVDEYVVSNYSI